MTAHRCVARGGGRKERRDGTVLLDLEGLRLDLRLAVVQRLPRLEQLGLEGAEVIEGDALHGKRNKTARNDK